MIRTAAHKQSQHQVFISNGKAAFEHGKEVAKNIGFSNTSPVGLVALDLGYVAGSEFDQFVAGYRAALS